MPAPGIGGKEKVPRSPAPALTALFESAVGPQFRKGELSFGAPTDPRKASSISAAMARASAIAEYPPSLRLAAAHAAGLSKVPLTEVEEQAEARRQQELVTTIRAMQECETDLDLLTYMEKNIFTMVSTDSPTSDSLNIKGKNYTFPSASYADLLSEGMRLLSKVFRDLSSTLSVFERIKALGAESYVVGCSVTVYNHVLEAKWEAYRDIHQIWQVLNEMKINGIEGDLHTVEILRTLSKDRVRMSTDGPGLALSEMEKDVLLRVEEELTRMADTIKEREMRKYKNRASTQIQLVA